MVKDGLITRDQLRLALERQVVFGGRIGTNIVELGILEVSCGISKPLLQDTGR